MNSQMKSSVILRNNPSSYFLVVATRFWDRVSGFLIKRPHKCILLISPCKSIHTFGMRENLDVAFIDREGLVVRSDQGVSPRKVLYCRGAHSVLERHASDSTWYSKGERVMVHV